MRFPAKRFRAIAIALFLAVAASVTVLADTITASSMRLLSYEGAVDIADSSGKAKTLMKNVRFASGDVLSTGTDGLASVGLDSSKVLTVDHSSKVGFSQSGKQLKLSLEEGSLLLDVQKSLMRTSLWISRHPPCLSGSAERLYGCSMRTRQICSRQRLAYWKGRQK